MLSSESAPSTFQVIVSPCVVCTTPLHRHCALSLKDSFPLFLSIPHSLCHCCPPTFLTKFWFVRSLRENLNSNSCKPIPFLNLLEMPKPWRMIILPDSWVLHQLPSIACFIVISAPLPPHVMLITSMSTTIIPYITTSWQVVEIAALLSQSWSTVMQSSYRAWGLITVHSMFSQWTLSLQSVSDLLKCLTLQFAGHDPAWLFQWKICSCYPCVLIRACSIWECCSFVTGKVHSHSLWCFWLHLRRQHRDLYPFLYTSSTCTHWPPPLPCRVYHPFSSLSIDPWLCQP